MSPIYYVFGYFLIGILVSCWATRENWKVNKQDNIIDVFLMCVPIWPMLLVVLWIIRPEK